MFQKVKKIAGLPQKFSAMEKRIVELEKTVRVLETKNKKMKEKLEKLEDKSAELENTVAMVGSKDGRPEVAESNLLDKTKKREEYTTAHSFDLSFENFINKKYDKLSDIEKKIYCEDICEIDNINITLRGLCAGLGVDVPKKFESIADEKQTVAFRSKKVQRGDICLIIRSAEDFHTKDLTTKDQYDIAIEKGAKMIIMGRDDFNKFNLNEDDFPVILIDNNNERVLRFFSLLRRKETAKVVMLTGSVGKTTTKDLCYSVVKNRFKTFANSKNTNTPHQVAKHLFYNTNRGNEVYIQECGAGYKGSVRFSASMLQPDIFILTNVYKHHLQVYKTLESIFDDKTSADDYLSENGVIITNYDDENIRNHQFKHRVKSFAINCEDVDYKAINIKQVQEYLHFDIYEKATGKTTGVNIKILGEHNVYNALAAFAMGRELGLTEEQIKEDLLEYRPEGVRQNLSNVGGVYINLDCYNVAEESIISMLSAGEKFELKEGGRRFALIGGENKLGKDVVKRSVMFGQEVAAIKMDKYLFCGTEDRSRKALNHFGDAESIRKGFAKVSDIPNEFAMNVDDMIRFLEENVERNDLVMFKGIYYLDMPIAADKVFGTSFCFGLSNYIESRKTISVDGCKAYLIPEFGELEIVALTVNDGKLIVPNAINEYPTFRIKENAFEGRADIASIDFGGSIKNIGIKAFANCTGIQELVIPGNVLVIEEKAFANCTELKRVEFKHGVTHIAMKAFSGCEKLEEVIIPSTVGMIEMNAFKGCEKLQIVCAENTVAHVYAVENNIAFRLDKSLEKSILKKRIATSGQLPDAPYGPKISSISNAGIEFYWKKVEKAEGYEIFRSYDEENFEKIAEVNKRSIGEYVDNEFDTEKRSVYYKSRSFIHDTEGERVYSDFTNAVEAQYREELTLERSATYMYDGTTRSIRAFYGWGELEDAEWTSDNEAVATIDRGVIHALSTGEAMLTCYSPNLQAKATSKVVVNREAPKPLDTGKRRFSYDAQKNVWVNKDAAKTNDAVLMMVGDLMCGAAQTRKQYTKENNWSYNDSYEYVRSTTASADFVVGNLETLMAAGWPYMIDESYIDNKNNCNNPSRYLDAVLYGGFDAVTMSNNHNCDGGVRGLKETIDAVGLRNIPYTGIFKDADEKRYMIVDVNGIKVGILAYMSQYTGFNNKDADWSQEDKDTLLNVFSEERAAKDIEECRADGAEYIIAYMHWGKKNFKEITKEQKKEAKAVAEVGVDYIVGANPHVVQVYRRIKCADGRRVPCFYSTGNFQAYMNQIPQNRDSIMVRIRLQRDENGKVILAENNYIPYHTYKEVNGCNWAPVSVSKAYNKGVKKSGREKFYNRIKEAVGDKIEAL